MTDETKELERLRAEVAEARAVAEMRTTEAMLAQARAEQAERERDEAWEAWRAANATASHMAAKAAENEAARERAEADNAALLAAAQAIDARRHDLHEALYTATNDMPPGRWRDAAVDVWAKPGPGGIPDGPHPGAALLERLRALEGVVAKFREFEWARGDWQGVCPFRRHKDVVCMGTDGRVAAVGTPSPVPHSEHCPFHALDALRGKA